MFCFVRDVININSGEGRMYNTEEISRLDFLVPQFWERAQGLDEEHGLPASRLVTVR